MWKVYQLLRTNVLTIVFYCFSLCLSNSLLAQPDSFPQNWYGEWRGVMVMEPPITGYPSSFPMMLSLAPTDSAHITQYTIQYRDEKDADIRAYLLKKGLSGWVIDEQNDIILSCSWFDNVLFSWFEIQEQSIICKITFEKDIILYEIFGGGKRFMYKTGDKNGLPPVYTYDISFYQYARLSQDE
ncbi:MAG: hypothetical protein LC101_09235 [Flavobacteriales bacterium]|nr:hypothetical protein [Flavobacteriales bacterium]MCZ2443942.1 hypothetical protein [Flavobacteriales bacterium]